MWNLVVGPEVFHVNPRLGNIFKDVFAVLVLDQGDGDTLLVGFDLEGHDGDSAVFIVGATVQDLDVRHGRRSTENRLGVLGIRLGGTRIYPDIGIFPTLAGDSTECLFQCRVGLGLEIRGGSGGLKLLTSAETEGENATGDDQQDDGKDELMSLELLL